MFENSGLLEKIWANEDFDFTDESSESMFDGCFYLQGSQGTKFASEHIISEYARLDKAAETPSFPGYFLSKDSHRLFWGTKSEGEDKILYLFPVRAENVSINSNVQSIRFSENFTAKTVNNFSKMFYEFEGKILDLLSFTPSSSAQISEMFAYCNTHERIYVNEDKWLYSYQG